MSSFSLVHCFICSFFVAGFLLVFNVFCRFSLTFCVDSYVVSGKSEYSIVVNNSDRILYFAVVFPHH